MEADFWHERWERGETGFHKADINPLLSRWWPSLELAAGSAVWVPLCGKSLDMIWLAERGHRVIGVELSRTALEAFAEEAGISLQWQACGQFSEAQAHPYRFYCGDYFALSEEHVASVAGVYDRAALIALPEPMRADYVEHMRRILPAGWKMLLVTLDYPQHERPGPPFAVSDNEVRRLFAGCSISLLEDQSVLEDHQVFKQQGMTRLNERVYLISQG
ncbi:MAG: thiopurine S-methyltransferase [Pseudomonas profundi]|uniref:thiopurine S-methyltransferase n=1 Tax=Pseudomonas profundi TaxID=1981513 RepID=UPI003001B616